VQTNENFSSYKSVSEEHNNISGFSPPTSKNNSKKINSERIIIMSNNKNLVPEAKEALNKFKMEAAAEVGVNLKQGYNGNLTSKEAGSVGGQMVKKMVESYENSVKGSNS
jgi:hypothetical protein